MHLEFDDGAGFQTLCARIGDPLRILFGNRTAQGPAFEIIFRFSELGGRQIAYLNDREGSVQTDDSQPEPLQAFVCAGGHGQTFSDRLHFRLFRCTHGLPRVDHSPTAVLHKQPCGLPVRLLLTPPVIDGGLKENKALRAGGIPASCMLCHAAAFVRAHFR